MRDHNLIFVVIAHFTKLLVSGFKMYENPEVMEGVQEFLTTLEAELFQETYLPTFVAAMQQRSRRKKEEEVKQKARDIKALQKLDTFTEPGPVAVRSSDVRPQRKPV